MQNTIIAKNKTAYNAIVTAMHDCKQEYIAQVLDDVANPSPFQSADADQDLLDELATLSADITQIKTLLAQFAITKNVEELANSIYRTDELALSCQAIDFFTPFAQDLCNDFQNGEYNS